MLISLCIKKHSIAKKKKNPELWTLAYIIGIESNFGCKFEILAIWYTFARNCPYPDSSAFKQLVGCRTSSGVVSKNTSLQQQKKG